jgi:hypothetical protein
MSSRSFMRARVYTSIWQASGSRSERVSSDNRAACCPPRVRGITVSVRAKEARFLALQRLRASRARRTRQANSFAQCIFLPTFAYGATPCSAVAPSAAQHPDMPRDASQYGLGPNPASVYVADPEARRARATEPKALGVVARAALRAPQALRLFTDTI